MPYENDRPELYDSWIFCAALELATARLKRILEDAEMARAYGEQPDLTGINKIVEEFDYATHTMKGTL